MQYFRSTKGKTVALAVCLVCAILLVVAVPLLKPTAMDLWYRQQLRSFDPDVRARAVEAVCSSPSPMAVRELVLMFSREDEAANIDVLALRSVDPSPTPARRGFRKLALESSS